MSWEVRTMQSKTLSFNATLFRKNLTRFWPLWGLASFVGALFPLAVLLDMVHRGWNVLSAPDFTGMYYDAVSAVPVISAAPRATSSTRRVMSSIWATRGARM